jgi:V/A-type H+-transporting ATPase subunit D
MAEIKLSKNELRLQQNRLATLQKYLPTLQLKKALLQTEIGDAKAELAESERNYVRFHAFVEQQSGLLAEKISIDLSSTIKIKHLGKRYDNIAGVEVPYFETLTFEEVSYPLFDTPVWLDSFILALRNNVEAHVKVEIAREKKEALEKELRSVSIKVNLFEKILIPRAQANIKKIKVFLGDQQLAAVSQAKVAKRKIEQRKAGLRIKEAADAR